MNATTYAAGLDESQFGDRFTARETELLNTLDAAGLTVRDPYIIGAILAGAIGALSEGGWAVLMRSVTNTIGRHGGIPA